MPAEYLLEEIKSNILLELYRQQGGKMISGTGIISSETNSSYPHYNDTQGAIKEKDILIIDCDVYIMKYIWA